MTSSTLAACVLMFASSFGVVSGPGAAESATPTWRVPVYQPSRPLVAGCTPILKKFSDGTIAFAGCPSAACPGPVDECQAQGSTGDNFLKCRCIDGGPFVLCEGVAYLDAGGLVVDWDCFKVNCAGTCVKQPAPAGEGEFYACDCS